MPSFTITRSGTLTTFTLPPRRNRPLTRLYGLLIAAAAVVLPAAFFFFEFKFRAFGALTHGWQMLVGVFSLFSYGLGLAATAYVTVTINPTTLTSQRRIGFIRTQTPIPLHAIARLELDVPDLLRRSILPNNTSLNAELSTGNRIPIAQGYPRELLTDLARELSLALNAAALAAPPHPYQPDLPAPIDVIDVSGIPPVARDVLTQPAKSLITRVDLDNLQTFIIKRYGQIRSTSAFVACQILLAALLAAASIGTHWLFLEWQRHAVSAILPALTAVAGLLVLVLMLRVFHVFFRRCVLIVAENSLTRVTRGPFGKSEMHWARHEIAQLRTHAANQKSFRVGTPSAANISLILTTHAKQRTTLLTGPELDLRWLATQLRALLNLPNR